MGGILRKELADHFSSVRFPILLSLIAMVALVTAFMAGSGMREDFAGRALPRFAFLMLFTSTGQFFSLAQFIAFFGPLIGLVMGFDAINRERAQGTLAKLLSQPIYRDAVINGKFLAGVITVTIMMASLLLLVTGIGLGILGLVPSGEELARLAIYLVVSIFYISFWLGASILFSILMRNTASSALCSLALWIFFGFFIAFGAGLIASGVSPVDNPKDPRQVLAHAQVARGVSLVSPVALYTDATSAMLDPFRKTTQNLVLMGRLERISISRFKNPLPLDQSLLLVWPYLSTLLALTLVCFGISYLSFMRQEIRSI